MTHESRGNIFCIVHKGPLSECPDECQVKQGAKPKAQIDSKDGWGKILTLPIIDERAVVQVQVDEALRIARDRQKADLARLAKVRAEQEDRLARLRGEEELRMAQLKKDQDDRLAELKKQDAMRMKKLTETPEEPDKD